MASVEPRQSIESFEDRAGAAEAERRDAASGRRRRRTVPRGVSGSAAPLEVFSGDVAVPELPSHRLEELFQAKAAALLGAWCVSESGEPMWALRFDIGARSSSTASVSSLIAARLWCTGLDANVQG